ncbi:MAG: hypothetical protein U0797_27350 [Gemmataceae bacterium]
MQECGVVVLLCGVRAEFLEAIDRVGFRSWLPGDRVYPEEVPGNAESMSSTIRAVTSAYEILGDDPARGAHGACRRSRRGGWYYMI